MAEINRNIAGFNINFKMDIDDFKRLNPEQGKAIWDGIIKVLSVGKENKLKQPNIPEERKQPIEIRETF
jgi:hypothetical protein